MKKLIKIFLLLALSLGLASCSNNQVRQQELNVSGNNKNTKFNIDKGAAVPSPNIKLEKPQMQINVEKDYQAVLTTDKGDIAIDLFENKTPITVNNFIYLTNNGFYNNTIFHRIVKGFMIQGGDPNGDGTGGPGYRFADESFNGEYERGIVAMANAGPNTNGSQFFIMHQNYNLPKNYVIFGKVISGMDIVDKIAESSVGKNSSGENSKPITPTKIISVSILEK